MRTYMSCTGRVIGTDGRVDIPAFVHCPDHLTLVTAAGEAERIDTPWEGEGIRFQAIEVHRSLATGGSESERAPLDDSYAMARTLDDIRRQVGVVYAADGST